MALIVYMASKIKIPFFEGIFQNVMARPVRECSNFFREL